MYLFFIKTLFIFCVCDLCKGLELYEKRADFIESDISLGKNESWSESPLTELLQERPVAVVVELKESLLENVMSILGQESESNFPIHRTTLATFDSTGLQDVSVDKDIRQAIMNLAPTPDEREIFTPTIQVLGEVLQKDVPEGFILLLTTSRPLDEFYAENLMRSLMEKRCQLSILWAGNYQSDDYLLLKDLAERSGGKFGFITSNNNSDENASTEQEYPKLQFENLAQQIIFPEEDKYNVTEEEMPMVSRAADQKAIQKTVVPLIIEVASGTSLEARPGTATQIQFTVKNNLNGPVHVFFSAKYNGVIQSVQPTRVLLQPSGTATVIVNLFALSAPQTTNAVGTLTLVAEAANKVLARSAIISLAPQTTTDYSAPKMTYRYDGDCANYRDPQNCEHGQWNLEATFHDEDSGLLKVLSEPYGLIFQSEFVAGTKSPVTVYYTANCCQPNVIIWAEDLKGNFVKKSFDVFNQNLLAGEIAGIVLGVLLLLFIIAAVIVGIILYKRRNQRNMIIPRARTGSR